MLLSKLKALNNSPESSSDEDTPIKITKEALITKTELLYSKALQYLSKGQLDRAEDLLSQLLHSEIIKSLNCTQYKSETSQSLLGHLKYCCLTNLGNILFKKSKYPGALINYQEALLIDNSDLNLWYQIGLTHSKLYQTDLAISSFLQGITCNSSHWPTLDKLISLLYANNEYVCCLYYVDIGLKFDANYMKGHFIRNIIFKQFPSLICYFKSYCTNGGLDIECTEINLHIKQKVLNDIKSIKNNHKLCSGLKCIKPKPTLFAKHIRLLKNWVFVGKWLLQIYDYIFENFEHSFLYEPINFEFDCEFSNQNSTKNYICVDENCCDKNFENQSNKHTVQSTKRKKNLISLTDQLKSRRSSRNKSNIKLNESTFFKSILSIIPQCLLLNKDSSDNINSIKWSENSQDTMDLYRLQFSDSENCLKNSLTDDERLKLINDQNYFGSNDEICDLNKFIESNNKKPISDLLENFLIQIAQKWSILWPTILLQIYLDVFKRVWIRTEKNFKSHLIEDNLDEIRRKQITDDILCILIYGEILCNNYFQSKINQKPLDGGLIGGDFRSLWISGIKDALTVLSSNDSMTINVRFLWLRVLFHLQNKECGLIICNLLNTLLNFISDVNDYEIILPNLEYFYQINTKILHKLIVTLKRNDLLNNVKKLYKSKLYPNVVDILRETLKHQNDTEIGIPNYEIMTRKNQYIYMFNSLLELKNYHELFRWSESCLHETIIQYRKSLFEDDSIQKTDQSEFINNIFYAMLESIKTKGLIIFESLSEIYKSRLIQSVINLLLYLIETSDSNSEIDVVSPWLLIYNLLKYEESKNCELQSSQTDNIPPSLALLIISHEYLGKNAWCCFQDGILLFVTLSEIEHYIHSDLYHLTLVQEVDQIFYCLYKHQIKRNRPRFIQDHKSLGLALTWSRARQLVQFYKPIELPTFDGKTFTVNSDIQTMLKSVISLVPEEIKPDKLFDNLMAYIREEIDEISVNNKLLPEDVKDIYYLMADYYFKNKIWGKAVKYYSFDICYNVNRVDSWAGLALAQGSQLEIKLNSCESIKNDYEIIKIAFNTGQCYKHSLKISPGNITLLLEFGLLTYYTHSYCSRLLKQETSNMNLQMFSEFEKIKDNMINTAKKCFETANKAWINDSVSQDERWMHYYILGKISEKSEDCSILFIEYYLKAIQFLNSYNAIFPKHITYTDPQYYSIEVLEIYYRIHAGVLKLLEKHDNQFNKKIFEQIESSLDELSNMSPIFDKNKETSKICPDNVNVKMNKKDDVNTTKIFSNSDLSYDQNNALEISNIPFKQMKLNNDLAVQEFTNLRWKLIQRCLVALEDCIKRFPQHYKSYYRLAYFYFRCPFYKDYDKFRKFMFGECGLFFSKKHNNFFHGIWRIPLSEIDRPGSFAYHMSRSIHLLLDFLKETGDHKMLLDLAIQLKYTPDLDKKYLRDNERESFSKEALFLSIQILKSQCANHSNNNKKFLLIQVYKCYKRVLKCWHQKDKNLSKILLNIYQNITETKDDVSIDIIIKYCQKLQMEEREFDTKKKSLNTQKLSPNQGVSSALNNYIPQSIFPVSLETNRASQQKLKKLAKHKLKHSNNINNEQKIGKKQQNIQTAKYPKKLCFKLESSIVSLNTFNESVHNLDSAIEIIKLPINNDISCNKYREDSSSQKTSAITTDINSFKITPPKIMTIDSHNLKSMCINLDSKAEHTRIKSSTLQHKDSEKINIPIMSNPSNIFSCPDLSITPIVNANCQINEPSSMSHQIKNIQTKSKN